MSSLFPPRKPWKFSDLLTFQNIALIFFVIALVYCLYTVKQRPKEFNFSTVQNLVVHGQPIWKGRKFEVKKKSKKRVNKHEEKCREIFQDIYELPFKSVRPDWLKNPVTKRNLELDGFCSKVRTPIGMGLAFEYDGIQHAQHSKYFQRHGESEFLYQCQKDSWKDIRCKEEGVFLVRIPHFIVYEDLERYIVNKLEKNKLLPVNYHLRMGMIGRKYPRHRSGSMDAGLYM